MGEACRVQRLVFTFLYCPVTTQYDSIILSFSCHVFYSFLPRFAGGFFIALMYYCSVHYVQRVAFNFVYYFAIFFTRLSLHIYITVVIYYM